MIYRNLGVTLIEMLSVIIIVGLLLAAGYVTQSDQTYKARRADATRSLRIMQEKVDRYIIENNVTTMSSSNFNLSSACNVITTPLTAICSVDSEGGYYTISLTIGSNMDYSLIATAKSGTIQYNDLTCRALHLSNLLVRTSFTSTGAGNTEPGTCWPGKVTPAGGGGSSGI